MHKRVVAMQTTLVPRISHYWLRARLPSYIGEKVEFYVEISNASNSAIRILKIDASISSETGTCPLDEVGTSSKYLSIAPSTSISLRFVKLLCEIGEQTYYSYLSLSPYS